MWRIKSFTYYFAIFLWAASFSRPSLSQERKDELFYTALIIAALREKTHLQRAKK